MPFIARGAALALSGCEAVAVWVGIGVAGCSGGEWILCRAFVRIDPGISHSVAIVSRLVNVLVKIDVINKNSVNVLDFGIEIVLGIGLLEERGVGGVWRQIWPLLRGNSRSRRLRRQREEGAGCAARTGGDGLEK